MDPELKHLDLATAAARRLATAALGALHDRRTTLRQAAANYVASVASRRLDATRRASVEVIASLSDQDIAELRLWTDEQIEQAREVVAREIEECDFWIPDAPGLSPSDVTTYSAALMAKPKDTRTGIPQAMVLLFDHALAPFRRGLAAVGLAVIPADAEPHVEVALLRAWRGYREAAVECVSRWADVDEHYHASAERFQEMRWELAAEAAQGLLRERRESEEIIPEAVSELEATSSATEAPAAEVGGDSIAAQADAASKAPPEAVVRGDSETLVPAVG